MQRTKHMLRALCLGAVVAATLSSNSYSAGDDDADIRQVIATTWDRPDARVEINPVVVAGDHAIAGWTQGERGGRALLRKSARGWSVILCSGDPIRKAANIALVGVPARDAETLEAALAAAERTMSADRLAKFASFEGSMRMHEGAPDDPEAHP